MSEIKAQLQADIKVAMKAREQEKLTNLRGLMAAIKQVEIDTRADVNDAKVLEIVQKEIKKRRDTLEYAVKQERQDIIDQNEKEIALLQSYLGEQLSEEELRSIIQGLVDGGANNIGVIMGALNKEHKGKFEGKIASTLVKDALGS